jgi:hypothetical protein
MVTPRISKTTFPPVDFMKGPISISSPATNLSGFSYPTRTSTATVPVPVSLPATVRR